MNEDWPREGAPVLSFVSQMIRAGLFELVPSAMGDKQCLKTLKLLGRRLITAVDDEGFMKGPDQGVGLILAIRVPIIEALFALALDLAHQSQQHLRQVIQHLAPSMANDGQELRLAARRKIFAQLRRFETPRFIRPLQHLGVGDRL